MSEVVFKLTKEVQIEITPSFEIDEDGDLNILFNESIVYRVTNRDRGIEGFEKKINPDGTVSWTPCFLQEFPYEILDHNK